MLATDTTCQTYAPDAAADRVTTRLDQLMLCNEQQRADDVILSANTARLRWLETAIAAAEQREHLFRTAREEAERLSMRRPLTTERAYAHFGLLLGTLPPAAILLRFALLSQHGGSSLATLFYLMLFGLPMIALCAVVGRLMGRKLAPALARAERRHWFVSLLYSVAVGFAWACATGAAGGAVVFLIGALYGLVCALPFGLTGFPLFTICHRMLVRGGMIDARHFWPIACGITLSCAALIFSPTWLPY